MIDEKLYVQPLGLLRGCYHSDDRQLGKICGGVIRFSAIRIIRRTLSGIKTDMIPVNALEQYIRKQSEQDALVIKNLIQNIEYKRPSLQLNDNRYLDWDKPVIQGILNVTPDSFSDGGSFEDAKSALNRVKQMLDDGADIIDVGGETTKPGATAISEDLERKRVLPVIQSCRELNCIVSIDSRNASVMKAAIEAGAAMINDVSALTHDQKSVDLVKELGAPVILMHAQGSPENMQDDPSYGNVVLDIYDYLERRINQCLSAGIKKENIIIDPGIGFGKTVEHNLQLLANISLFHSLGVPILVGISRKSFIGKITDEKEPTKRVSGSIAAAQYCLDQGVQVIRVHDVGETVKAVSVYKAIIDQSDLI